MDLYQIIINSITLLTQKSFGMGANMKIGIVTTWFERGAGYVSKLYKQALTTRNKVYIYARGGLKSSGKEWNDNFVTYGLELPYTLINRSHLLKWIKKNHLEVVFFNEQHEFSVVAEIKKSVPKLKNGCYIDYYKEDEIKFFNIYDFVICNTKRHLAAMQNHKQPYYVKWGTDINMFKPNLKEHKDIIFFHSMGMSFRKGTKTLIESFIDGKIYEHAQLIIHTQLPANKVCSYTEKELKKYKIEIISKTVTAPGLYYLGDVYVYPTDLDGLGLTIYEALSCGLPVITTNHPPMNEIITNGENGLLVDVQECRSRADGYYWPLSICSKESLISCMNYFVDHYSDISIWKTRARTYAKEELDFSKRYSDICAIFENSKNFELDTQLYHSIIIKEKHDRKSNLLKGVANSSKIFSLLWKWAVKTEKEQ